MTHHSNHDSKDNVNKDTREQSISVIASYRQPQYLAEASSLSGGGQKGVLLGMIGIVCGLITAFILWAAWITIDEVAIAQGKIIPSGDVQQIQHLEGGIIAEVLVQNGEQVRAGQTLVTLSPVTTLAELEQLNNKAMALEFDLARLRAYFEEDTTLLEEASQSIALAHPEHDPLDYAVLVRDQMALLENQNASRRDERRILNLQMTQAEEQIAYFGDIERVLQDNVALLQEELTIYRELNEVDAVSSVMYLQAQRNLNQSQSELLRTRNDKNNAEGTLAESITRLAALNAGENETILQEVRDTDTELFSTQAAISKLEDRLNRLSVTSNVDGIINVLDIFPGNVVASGDILFEVVPLEDTLVVEAEIATHDIGHVFLGDRVSVKVATYDFTQYGSIPGTVSTLSASTYLDEEGQPYYRAEISLDKSYLGSDENDYPVLPGMTVVADILTGSRSLLAYLLKPIHQVTAMAFNER